MTADATRLRGIQSDLVEALRKPEAKQLTKSQAELRPFHDEKHEIYKRHNDVAGDVFERAREVRASMASVYEQRNKDIHDRLEGLQNKRDVEAKAILDSLRDFATRFDSNLAGRRKGWKKELKERREALTRRHADADADASRLDGLIRQEHEDCKAHTSAEVGPILEKLQEHRDALAKAAADREAAHQEFRANMEKSLGRLRCRLTEESTARRREHDETLAHARRQYAELSAAQARQGEDLRQRLAAVKAALESEHADASGSAAHVTGELLDFMAHFERSVGEGLEKQELTKTLFKNLKASVRFDTS